MAADLMASVAAAMASATPALSSSRRLESFANQRCVDQEDGAAEPAIRASTDLHGVSKRNLTEDISAASKDDASR
jgi:hypothetical protein